MPLLGSSRDEASSNTVQQVVADQNPDAAPWAATNETLASYVGESLATMSRVETILKDGTEAQITALRSSGGGKKGGVRTIYEKVQTEKLKGSSPQRFPFSS
jgi:hypothetical protein